MRRTVLPFLVAVVFVCAFTLCIGCNEAICASIVSKCMLTGACKCENTNRTCIQECTVCLDYLYFECCTCVEMCNKTSGDGSLSQKSTFENLGNPITELFAALTESTDPKLRWTSYTVYPFMHVDGKEVKFRVISNKTSPEEEEEEEDLQENCTVAFLSNCTSLNRCKESCRSMGSSGYRWFHDGCCECLGTTCVTYGINESRCINCSHQTNLMDIDQDDEEVIIQDPEKAYQKGNDQYKSNQVNTEENIDKKGNDIYSDPSQEVDSS